MNLIQTVSLHPFPNITLLIFSGQNHRRYLSRPLSWSVVFFATRLTTLLGANGCSSCHPARTTSAESYSLVLANTASLAIKASKHARSAFISNCRYSWFWNNWCQRRLRIALSTVAPIDLVARSADCSKRCQRTKRRSYKMRFLSLFLEQLRDAGGRRSHPHREIRIQLHEGGTLVRSTARYRM